MTERNLAAECVVANQNYGRASEDVFIAGFAFERAMQRLEWLLDGDRWRLVSPGFDDINAFLDSFKLDKDLRLAAEQRKRIALRIKELQPTASIRHIARVVGSSKSTIADDLSVRDRTRGSQTSNDIKEPASNAVPNRTSTLLGSTAAKIVAAMADRADRRSQNAAERDRIRRQPTTIPDGKFSCIVVDPPWPTAKIERDVRPNQVGFDYPTLSEDEISSFPIDDLADTSCHLFLWTTQKFLPFALSLIAEWGFRYVCAFVWHKAGGFQPVGLPQFNCEFVLYARRGSPQFVDTTAFPTCFQAPRREHSRKPDFFYETVRRVTDGPRIDVFSRESREGFAQYGNEPGRFAV
jgi:N6-adenosine-specific RNA methylase IME4